MFSLHPPWTSFALRQGSCASIRPAGRQVNVTLFGVSTAFDIELALYGPSRAESA
jgi:hypothetical protein